MRIDPFSFREAAKNRRRLDIIQPRLQIVGTRGQALGQDTNGAEGPTNVTHTRNESRYLSRIGPAAVGDLRLLYANSYMIAGSGDSSPANAITVEAALEIANVSPQDPGTNYPTAFPAKWLGANQIVIQPSTAHVMSDPIPVRVPAGGDVWVRTGAIVPAGQKLPRGVFASATGESARESAAATSSIFGTGVLSIAGSSAANGFGMLGLLGIPEKPIPAVYFCGDSIPEGSGDAGTGDGNGARGFVARGLNNYNSSGIYIPWVRATLPSDNALAWRSHQSQRRMAAMQYCNIMICSMGGNLLSGGGVTALQMYQHLRAI